MKTRIALLAAPLVFLAACSGEEDPVIYTLATGTYAVSGATVGTATPGDQCGLLGTYNAVGKQIGIDVNAAGTTASFDLSLADLAIQKPSATISGNTLVSPVEANYTVNLGNCVLRVHRNVVGDLTANDATALSLHAQITAENDASDCVAPYLGIGCQSDIHFLATRVP